MGELRIRASERAGAIASYADLDRSLVNEILDRGVPHSQARADWPTRVRALLTAASVGVPLIRIEEAFNRIDLRSMTQDRAMHNTDEYLKHFDVAIKPLLPRKNIACSSEFLEKSGESSICAFVTGISVQIENSIPNIYILNNTQNLFRWAQAWATLGPRVTRSEAGILTPGSLGGTFRVSDDNKIYRIILAESRFFQQQLGSHAKSGDVPLWLGNFTTKRVKVNH